MKKKFLLLLLVFSTSVFSFCQDIDKRLLQKYSKKELVKIQKENPNEYTFLIKALDKGVFICDIPQQKSKSIVFDGSLKIDPNETHNFISLGKDITDKYQYYKIEGTNKMLAILPRIALDENLLNEKSKK